MGLEIRKAVLDDAENIAIVHTNAWRESYRGIIDQDFLDTQVSLDIRIKRRIEILQNPEKNHAHFVAEYDGQIVGFICCGAFRIPDNTPLTNPPQGEISAVYLLDSAKRQGIGKKLFKTAVNALIDQNYTTMGIWVLSENTVARGFYHAMGGTTQQEDDIDITIGDRAYQECLYRYDDLTKIISYT